LYEKDIKMNFSNLHNTSTPLIISNVWDVSSAKIAEKLGFKTIGTSSGAIATMLGYEDGEQISFEEVLYIIKRIKANTTLPLSVDLEAGYSRNPQQIIKHIQQLLEVGVSGINIEDSVVNNHERTLVDSDDFSSILKEIKNQIGDKLFINVRTDTYLLNIENPLEETLQRIKEYEKAGADGIFIPCLVNESDIQTLCKSTVLPINIMCMPELADFETLQSLGIKRISMGNFVYNKIQKDLENHLSKIISQQHFQSVFE
jgi:2-methylisocitrate lyase-like PEP mutase family enzyme